MVKKYLISILALLAAFIATELIVSKILNFPKYYGYKKFVFLPETSRYNVLKWEEPYYTFMNVEAGNKFFSHNNIGLAGSDVKCNEKSKYIFVLGSSYIQAHQVPRYEVSTAIFQEKLMLNNYENYQVINLGESSHDPFLSWYRSRFFENYFKPECIILVLERYDVLVKLLSRFKSPLKFSLSENFGKNLPDSKIYKTVTWFLKKSSFLNLIEKGFKAIKNKFIREERIIGKKDVIVQKTSHILSEELISCLRAFKKYYNNKFILLSLFSNDEINKELKIFCSDAGIKFEYDKTIMSKENQFKSVGHLNSKGNELLGNFLFFSFQKNCSKPHN